MFNPKKTDDTEKSQGFSATANNSKAFSAYANAAEKNCSILNEWLTMRGDLESTGDILVKGKIHGNIQCKLLIVDTQAQVEGGIEAEEVVVRGATRGTIRAKSVRVEKTGNVDSEMYQESFSSEEGARIRGVLRNYDELDSHDHLPKIKLGETSQNGYVTQ